MNTLKLGIVSLLMMTTMAAFANEEQSQLLPVEQIGFQIAQRKVVSTFTDDASWGTVHQDRVVEAQPAQIAVTSTP